MAKWFDAKKITPKVGELCDEQFRESAPCLIFGRDSYGRNYAYAVSVYVFDEDEKTGEWTGAYDYYDREMSDVIAWMPLPEPPGMTAKGENDGKKN